MHPKKRCEKCGRLISKSRLRINRINKEIWCKRCFRKYGENRFYAPESFAVSKYNLTLQEKQEVYRQLRRKGYSYERARNQIAYEIRWLRNSLKRKQEWKRKKIWEKKQQELNRKKFLEGLR